MSPRCVSRVLARSKIRERAGRYWKALTRPGAVFWQTLLALAVIASGAARIVRVSEDEIADAIRILYAATHNVAEGAGAAPLAALVKEKARYAKKRVGLILTGGNIDTPVLAKVLAGQTPAV